MSAECDMAYEKAMHRGEIGRLKITHVYQWSREKDKSRGVTRKVDQGGDQHSKCSIHM